MFNPSTAAVTASVAATSSTVAMNQPPTSLPALPSLLASSENTETHPREVVQAIAYPISAFDSEAMADQIMEVEAEPFYDPVFMAKPNQNYETVQNLIKGFIQGGQNSIPEDPKYRDMYESTEKTSFQNSTPPFEVSLLKTFPEIISGRIASMKISIATCSPEHQKFIEYINMWMQSKGKGIHVFYPFKYLIRSEYGTKNLFKPSASILELHRRVLSIENSIRDMLEFIFSVCRIKKLRSLSPLVLLNVQLLAKVGKGDFGKKASFLIHEKCDQVLIENLEKLGKPNPDTQEKDSRELNNLAKWIVENREDLMTRVCLAYTGTCLCVLPAYMVIALNAEKFFNLWNEREAKSLFDDLSDVTRELEALCTSEVQPVIYYGWKLTKFHGLVHSVYRALNTEIKSTHITFQSPKNSSLLPLIVEENGEVLLSDGYSSQIPEGHLRFFKEKKPYVIPFASSCKHSIKTLQQRREAAQHFLDWRKKIIDSYIARFFKDEPTPVIFEMMERGENKVLDWFNQDSCKDNLTLNLAPTASLMDGRQSYSKPFE